MIDKYNGPSHQDVCRKRLGLGPCDCCPECGDHRWNFGRERCLTCEPPELRPGRMSKSRKSKAKPKVELPRWLTKEPRTIRGRREAAMWAKGQGVDLPWEGWVKWDAVES